MIDLKNIPITLKIEGYWCKYIYEENKYKPINPKTNQPAKMNNKSTFGTFLDVSNSIGADITLNNVGYGLGIFSPIAAIDVNECVNDGKIDDDVVELIAECNSYAEYSPSGTGVRIIR